MRPGAGDGRGGRHAGGWGAVEDVARWDQAEAAVREVMASLAGIPDRQRWLCGDEVTTQVIDTLIDHLVSAHPRSSERVCPHALPAVFNRAPRPLVLDVARGVLACVEGCYPKRARSWPEEPACFDCTQPVGGFDSHDLFIAHGPVLVAAALCQSCRSHGPVTRVIPAVGR